MHGRDDGLHRVRRAFREANCNFTFGPGRFETDPLRQWQSFGRDLAESEWSQKLESLKNDHANAMTVLRKKLRAEREAHATSLSRAIAVQEELRAKIEPLPFPVIPVRSAPLMPTLEMSGVGSRDFCLPSFGGNDSALASLGRRTLSLTPSGKDISAFLSEAISSEEEDD